MFSALQTVGLRIGVQVWFQCQAFLQTLFYDAEGMEEHKSMRKRQLRKIVVFLEDIQALQANAGPSLPQLRLSNSAEGNDLKGCPSRFGLIDPSGYKRCQP
eukprot:890539-Amphidinium_carterae.1